MTRTPSSWSSKWHRCGVCASHSATTTFLTQSASRWRREGASLSIRVMTADDHPVVRKGISALVANEPDMSVVAEAADGVAAGALYHKCSAHVVLMDLRMPRLDGIAATQAIVAAHPDAHVVALTSYEGDVGIYLALLAGASGYLMNATG